MRTLHLLQLSLILPPPFPSLLLLPSLFLPFLFPPPHHTYIPFSLMHSPPPLCPSLSSTLPLPTFSSLLCPTPTLHYLSSSLMHPSTSTLLLQGFDERESLRYICFHTVNRVLRERLVSAFSSLTWRGSTQPPLCQHSASLSCVTVCDCISRDL